MDIAKLDKDLKAVAPVVGVSFGRAYAKDTWEVQFAPHATKKHKDDAAAVIAAFDLAAPDPVPMTAQRLADILVAKGVLKANDLK